MIKKKNEEEKKRTKTEDDKKEEENKKEVIDVEKTNDKKEKEDKEDSKEKKDKKDKKKDEKDPNEKSDDESKANKGLTEDDYFFSYYDLVTVKDGKIADALKKLGYNTTDISQEKEYTASYVPYSNNVFVLGSYVKNDFSIQRIDGKKLSLLYDFKENESFMPLGMIGDKVYGMYAYYENGQ